MIHPRRVVVIGGGFAGLRAARSLARRPVEVTVVDRRNHHLFQPLLYQVATAALSPADIAYPIRAALRGQANARTILAEARSIDVAARRVELEDESLEYDWLVLATGATHSYFGHDEWAPLAPGLKSIEDALTIRARILTAYERAERSTDDQDAWLTFVVVGAGPTGVELAGAMREIGLHALARDFRNIDPRQARVVLVEALDRVLPPYPEDLSAAAVRQLRELDVEVVTGQMVEAIDRDGVTLADGSRIAAKTVLWAAGVQASPLAKSLGVPLDRAGRVIVGDDLSLPDHPEVFVLGDLAAAKDADGEPVPGVAPAALQAGEHAARAIRADLANQPRPRFRYRDKGTMATIGRARAVAEFGRWHLSGWPAWALWLGVHVFFLIGFRNRVFVIASWAWNYLTFRRGSRLITGADPRRELGEEHGAERDR